MSTYLVWFRKDLRTYDNPALACACSNSSAIVLGIYVSYPYKCIAPRKASFIEKHLNSLRKSMSKIRIPLLFEDAKNFTEMVNAINKVCHVYKVDTVFYNYQYNIRKYDTLVEKMVKKVVFRSFSDGSILKPGSITTNNKEMYKIFTPFKKKFLENLKKTIPKPIESPKPRVNFFNLSEYQCFKKIVLSYPKKTFEEKYFTSSEEQALTALRNFCEYKIVKYENQRDIFSQENTSKLSSCLSIGVISPRTCLHFLLKSFPRALSGKIGYSWLNELIWREFYYNITKFFPKICNGKSFINWTNHIQWRTSSLDFMLWKSGRTGVPIIDAAMRQLNKTGWMHNRLRMITASFLVKNLMLDWRKGEKYFMSQLIDGDFSANNNNWQWTASTGTDASPYFRIFNPVTQSKKFDKNGDFIRRWVPELSTVSKNMIHDPWNWKKELNVHYVSPIVDLGISRSRVLKIYKDARYLSLEH